MVYNNHYQYERGGTTRERAARGLSTHHVDGSAAIELTFYQTSNTRNTD